MKGRATMIKTWQLVKLGHAVCVKQFQFMAGQAKARRASLHNAGQAGPDLDQER